MSTTVFIDGAVGTTGLEIVERLEGRSEFSLLLLSEDQRKDAAARRDAFHAADFAILCLPDDAAREAVALAEGAKVRIIDASTAHRVAEGWTFGFPEVIGRSKVAQAARVSNPGCYSPASSRCSRRWSARACCRRTGPTAATPSRAIRAAARR